MKQKLIGLKPEQIKFIDDYSAKKTRHNFSAALRELIDKAIDHEEKKHEKKRG